MPSDAPADVAADTPTDTPAEDTAPDTLADTPSEDASDDAPADVVSDAPSDTPSDASDAGLCPEEAPIGLTGCETGVSCNYGQECCCGDCYPSIVCNCFEGSWGCYYTDACMMPPDMCPEVPDGGDN